MLHWSLENLRKALKKFFSTFLFKLTFACVLTGMLIGLMLFQSLYVPVRDISSRSVIIPKGASIETISALLAQEHVIPSSFLFALNVRLRGLRSQLKAGEYEFPLPRTPYMVLKQLREGKTVVHSITIPEGLTSQEIAILLRQAPRLEGSLDLPLTEGILLPETYHYSAGETRLSLLHRMEKLMKKHLEALWAKRAENLPFKTPEEALILASLVEKETALPQERKLIARVFINRLHQGMKLQSDPTVIYGLKYEKGIVLDRPLLSGDLAHPTAYNTYTIPGLPPKPICNPGLASLEAVLHPAESQALYFVADGSGGHVFATTLKEHQKNHQKWRKIRDSVAKKGS